MQHEVDPVTPRLSTTLRWRRRYPAARLEPCLRYHLRQVELLLQELNQLRDVLSTNGRVGGIGRRDGLKSHCPLGRVGSSPTPGTHATPGL